MTVYRESLLNRCAELEAKNVRLLEQNAALEAVLSDVRKAIANWPAPHTGLLKRIDALIASVKGEQG